MFMSISPRVDIAFKKIFGVEENKDLLISLINSIVSAEDHVAEVTLLNPYNAQNFANDKLSILDIKAKGENGKLFNIEIQIADETNYDKRTLYYWGKLYTEQLKRGGDYSKLSKAIGVHILNFMNIANNEKYHNIFHITEKETGEPYFKDLELHTIELKKFTAQNSKETSELMDKIKTTLDIWIAFLTKHDLLNGAQLPQHLDDTALKKALDVLEEMNFSHTEREAYETHLKWLRMEASAVQAAEEKAEVRAMEKAAIKMLEQQIDLKIIVLTTGLSIERIQLLQESLRAPTV